MPDVGRTPVLVGLAVAALAGALVVFFATCPTYITGQVLAVDGGVSR